MSRDHSLEAARASRWACGILVLFVGTICLTLGMNVVSRELFVPTLPSGLFRQKMTVQLEAIRFANVDQGQIVEHTVDKSDFKVDQKESAHESKPLPEVKPESPKKVKLLRVLHKPKSLQKPAEQSSTKPLMTDPKEQENQFQQATQGSTDDGKSGGAGTSKGSYLGGGQTSSQESVLAVIVGVIEANKYFPKRARQRGIEGKVVLTVNVSETGLIVSVDIKEKHNSSLLNRAALRAAEKLQGMHLQGVGRMSVSVPVVFKIQK